MKSRTLVVLLVTMSAAWACDDQPAPMDELKFSMDVGDFLMYDGPQGIDFFRNANGSLSGSISLTGIGKVAHQDMLSGARQFADFMRVQFAIPPEFQYVSYLGNIYGKQAPVQPIADEFSVMFQLAVDGVPVEASILGFMLDAQGRFSRINASVPKLSTEMVAAVRGPTLSPDQIRNIIQADADAMPVGNSFGITPNQAVRIVGLEKMLIPKAPFVVYKGFVESCDYRIDAVSGAILIRHLTRKS